MGTLVMRRGGMVLPLVLLIVLGALIAFVPSQTDATVCTWQMTSTTCRKQTLKSGCLWYDSISSCRKSPYCHPTWDLATCTNTANSGSCQYSGGTCSYRTTPLPTINTGLDCALACPGVFDGNQVCSFCGTAGLCCNSDNPVGCIPVGCTTEFCCAVPGTLSPTTRAPSASPTSTRPSSAPSRSPTKLPTSRRPSHVPTTSPTKTPTSPPQPTKAPVPTTKTPSRSPSSSAPTASPSRTPTFRPSAQPTTTAPSASPITSSPTFPAPTQSPSLPTPSPSRAPTGAIPLHPDDQLAWRLFRTTFRDRAFCGDLDGVACNACGDLTSTNRRIVCDMVPVVTPTSAPNSNGGRLRRLQQQYELRIVEIRMRNSNLSGAIPVNVLSGFLPSLRLLDLSNDGATDANDLFYVGDRACLPLQSCVNGATQCLFPENVPPLCSPGVSSAAQSGFPMSAYVGIGVGALVVVIMLFVLYVYFAGTRRSRKEEKKRRKRKSKSRNNSAASSAPPPASSRPGSLVARKSGTGASMGERRVSFIEKPALVYKPDPNAAEDGARKRRRQSSLTSKQKKQWRPEYDPSTGKHYWLNDKTGEFSWVGPDEVPEDDLDIPPPPPDDDSDDDERYVQVPVVAEPENVRRASKRASAYDSSQWEVVFDEETNSRYMVNRQTGEFVVLNPDEDPEERLRSASGATGNAFDTAGDGDDEDGDNDNHDPLWKAVIDPENNEMYWIDVESGQVTFEEPITGTIVSAEMLEATGRYSRGQVLMTKPDFIKRPSGVSVASDSSKRRSSGLHTFSPPRRSSGLEALDLGNRRPSAALSDPNGSKNSGMFARILGRVSNTSVNDEDAIVVRTGEEDDDEYDDDDDDDDSSDEEPARITRRRS